MQTAWAFVLFSPHAPAVFCPALEAQKKQQQEWERCRALSILSPDAVLPGKEIGLCAAAGLVCGFIIILCSRLEDTGSPSVTCDDCPSPIQRQIKVCLWLAAWVGTNPSVHVLAIYSNFGLSL